MADMGAGVGGNQGGVGRPAMCWTPVMFAFVLHRFADLVGEGVKTDKGFKEVHVNSVARQVSEFSDQEVTGTQVYNHMRKWRQRWVKVCKLKELNGALWDEDNYSILLVEEHLLGYTKVNLN
jgi:methionine salvage enolase-phosphatase E1